MIILQLLLATVFAQTEPATEEASTWKITNETEASIIVAEGNTSSESNVIKQSNSFTKEKNVVAIKGSYLLTKSDGDRTAEAWMYSPRYERIITDQFNAFVAYTEEGDTFAGYEKRQSGDIGGKYYFVKKEKVETLFAELNYRFTKEKSVAGISEDLNYGRFYAEWTRTWTSTLSSKLWVEYLLNTEDADDYRVNVEPSIAVVMTEILSLKVSYLTKYNNLPVSADRKDSLFTTSIVASF